MKHQNCFCQNHEKVKLCQPSLPLGQSHFQADDDDTITLRGVLKCEAPIHSLKLQIPQCKTMIVSRKLISAQNSGGSSSVTEQLLGLKKAK